ncbi:hypothetical protein BaRGS_00004070 [Batillaria attramentaria]|uniref:Uncharacterized protein n=1 Tax=Batillaria attramentaria TaxID=370345 RepID=A0ABD0LYP9_9CAEN
MLISLSRGTKDKNALADYLQHRTQKYMEHPVDYNLTSVVPFVLRSSVSLRTLTLWWENKSMPFLQVTCSVKTVLTLATHALQAINSCLLVLLVLLGNATTVEAETVSITQWFSFSKVTKASSNPIETLPGSSPHLLRSLLSPLPSLKTTTCLFTKE